MKQKKFIKILALTTAASLALSISACAKTEENKTSQSASESSAASAASEEKTSDDEKESEDITNSNDGEHAIEVDGETAVYSDISVTKTGDSDSGDEADFYGDNAAVFATNGGTLTLTNITVDTNGTHANAVFSYGEGTTVNISDSVITTSGNCSGGLMTTGGGTMNAVDLDIHTTGNSSAAIRSDRGGGTVTVTGGNYTTDGTGSPVIYSTADITISDAMLESTASQGVVVEGRNSVTLNNVTLIADNNTKNSDKSDWYQAVMIYQSMSGDAAEGTASFTMDGGSLTNVNGDIFFVNNTVATITLTNVEIVNQDADGVFLRAAAAGWGNEGSNGGQVNLYLNYQTQDGDILVDSVSALNMYLASGSTYTGAINSANEGEVYVEIESGSKWVLTGDSYISGLTCDADGIDLNGHTLYINGVAYNPGTASTGIAIEMTTSSSGVGQPGNVPGDPPSGEKPQGDPPDGMPGDPPSGDPPQGGPGGDGREPPARPEDD
ncbi:MAG: hypothetical protein IKN14_01175 [Clostridiales bacterium]|nr:hypothetical protein [Clostridiales bacterium]